MKNLSFCILLTVIFVGFVRAEEIIQLGDPVSKVLEMLGKPRMKMKKNGVLYCIYDGGRIALKDGKVIGVPDGFSETLRHKQAEGLKKESFLAEQKAKGLVLYKSDWVTPTQKERLEASGRAKEEARLRAQAVATKNRYAVNNRYAKEAEEKRRQDAQIAESKRRFDENVKLRRDRKFWWWY